jgi:BON domain-containing protein
MKDSDIALCTQILVVLLHDNPDLVHTDVEGGIVYLQGIAADEQQKRDIEDAIHHLSGVRRVVNCLALERVAQLPAAAPVVSAHAPVEHPLSAPPRAGYLNSIRGRSRHLGGRTLGRRSAHAPVGFSR